MDPAATRASSERVLLAAAVLAVLVVVAHLPAVRAGYVWDDDAFVTDNLSLRSLEGLRRTWLEPMSPIVVQQYYPLTLTVLWLEYHAWGTAALGYHLLNILLHAASALLLWRLLVRLRVPGAWLAAAVWAVHPVSVESVAWVAELKNVLSGTLFLAAALAYVRFDPATFSDASAERRWSRYGAALALFGAALLAKTVTATLPAALLLVLWWKRGAIRGRDVVPLVPFFAAGAAMGAVTVWMERHHVGASGPEWSFTLADRVLIAGRAVWFYAAKLPWPLRLAFNYERWTVDPSLAWQWAFPAALVAVIVVLFALRRRIGRGPLVAVLFFCGTLAPALGFFDVYPMRYSFVADHFQYLASIGPIVLAIAVAGGLPVAWAARVVTAGAVLAALTLLTSARARVFHDPATLWGDTIAKNPASWLAHLDLVRFHTARGDAAAALAEAEEASRLRPDDAKVESWHALTLTAAGRVDDARRAHAHALALDPAASLVRYNYAYDLERWGETDAAAEEYRRTIALDPRTPWARTRLGHLLAERGDLAGAIALYREELELVPDSPTAAQNLARALLSIGDLSEAERVLAGILGVNPRDAKARTMLATVLMQRAETGEAERHLRRALADDPNLAEAHNSLGAVLVAQGRWDAGIAEYREALRLRPDYANAQRNLAAALAGKEHRGGG